MMIFPINLPQLNLLVPNENRNFVVGLFPLFF